MHASRPGFEWRDITGKGAQPCLRTTRLSASSSSPLRRFLYYLYALAFVIFDIEVVFLYPWAVAYNQLGLFALVEMAIFLLILVGGLVYAWRKGALEWV